MHRYAQGQPVHPTMIYESIGNFVILAFLWRMRLQNYRAGMLTAMYLILYGIVRSALTPLRMDNQFFEILGIRFLAPYTISFFMIVAGLVMINKMKLWYPQTPSIT